MDNYFPLGVDPKKYYHMHNKEFHFRDMHVYVNQLFKTHAEADNRYTYGWNDERTIKENHHVHIFLWYEGSDGDNIIAMGRFINICNQITGKPVYIHIPKKFRSDVSRIKRILNTVYCDGRKIKYDIILENNTNVTKFFVQEAGYPGITPEEWLLICWDGRKYARPVYFLPETNKTEEIFKEDAIDGEA